MEHAGRNGEPMLAPCEGCPIGDGTCPEIDDLSHEALAFSCVWDHEAHAGYREALWDLIGPSLSPGDAMRWIARRQAVWETHQKITQAEIAARQKEARNGDNSPA